jgi:hypothetical protein
MKIKNISKKAIAISVIAIVAFSMVGLAAVNNYLSNQVTLSGTVVAKTMDVKLSATPPTNWKSHHAIWGDWIWVDSITFGTITGGDIVKVYLGEQNTHAYAIDGKLELILTCDTGFAWGTGDTLLDFKSLIFEDHSGWKYDYIFAGTYSKIDNYRAKLTALTSSYPSGFVQVGELSVTFKDGAYGTYTLTAQVLPN